MNNAAVADPPTPVERVPCPNGCGAMIAPRGRGSHNKICPNAPDGQRLRGSADSVLRGRIQREIADAQRSADQHTRDAASLASGDVGSNEEAVNAATAIQDELEAAVAALERRDIFAKLLEDDKP